MSSKKHNVVINVPKVYDWVTRQVDLPILNFREPELSNLFPGIIGPSPGASDLYNFLQAYPGYTTEARVLEQSLYTSEVSNQLDRPSVEVTLPNGDDVTLEKVKILARGLLEVDIFDVNENVIATSNPIEFATVQTFYLHAPEDTTVNAFLSSGYFEADVVGDEAFSQLDVTITFCLDIHVIADVRLEVEASYVKPRHEFPISDIICRTQNRPPVSPLVFPGTLGQEKEKHKEKEKEKHKD
ncbi:hypothetical protein [Alkalicoccobacillus porphyridii]|uniref:Uncharacterized protein n=1 Tax=Alkalicoccobacillus porphyridii TaxID=2597270 RepID=A0A553ZXA9_9BACI|nr:hypothetical protein [Alkalicoccobacillus porphyridii]TSB46088.1 hypothetical protein FN960_12015 [Alkalicoccobacillus porphyridii]